MSEKFWQRLSFIVGIFTIGVVFGLTAFMASLEIKDLDLWLHLKMGKFISDHLFVPAQDILSCTIAGKPWVNHEWLFQVVVYQIWSVWGFNGLINMQIWVVLISFLILMFLAYSKERQFLSAFFLLLVLLIYQTRFTIRPDIFSLLFFVSYIWILSWFIDRRWSLWALVVIQVLWTNMHGFFFFGPVLIGIALLSESLKRHVPMPWEWNTIGRLKDEEYGRLKVFLPILLLACCINPLTFQGALYPLGVLFGIGGGKTKVFFDHITELQKPITMATIWTKQYGIYKLMILLSGTSLFLNRRKIDISTIFIWVIFLLFSLVAVRNMVFFAMASYLVFMANILTVNWQSLMTFRFSNDRFKYITGILIKGYLIFWMIDSGTGVAANGYFDFDTYERKSEFWGVSQRSFPYHAVDFLSKNQIKGNFFNDFNSGAYMIGRVYPNIKVYIDGRTEVYGSKFFEHYMKIWREGDKDSFLKDVVKYNLTGVLLNNNNQEIPPKVLKMMYQLPDWKIVYFDYDAVIFLKNIPANKQWIDRFAIDLTKWQTKPMDLQRLGSKRIDPMPISRRGNMLKTLGLFDVAYKEAQEALKVSPDDFDAHSLLAEYYENKGDNQKSFEYARIATVLRPYDVDIRVNLARAYERLMNVKQAKEQFEKCIELDSRNAKAHFGMARVLALLGDEKKALEFLRKAEKLDKEDKIDVQKIHDIIDKNKKLKNATAAPISVVTNRVSNSTKDDRLLGKKN